ncbi:FtsX-like permease family protein [Actinoplanes oblitus]|uniref:FtsX-like permease family protein n=1 Tax=Actinoplanes oblitus TaxID=3040509 RepID=A0ABY8WV35_9ACTN|nr:FtsX-like permease family protein [Actinoplanes oblitus]WIN00320.1 FtsX-like permease family protein [Actinoplanes oblitus]
MISLLRLRKVARDAWLTRTRIAMMVVTIALSVLAVSAFLSARAILGREIAGNYAATRPASATLNVPAGVDAATLGAVRAVPAVTDAAARTSVLARVRVGASPWRVLMLFAADADDPRRVATVATAPGAWPPPADGMLLERTALPFLGVAAGDRVTLQVPGAAPTPMTVSGAVHDGAVAPASQEQTAYGYVTTAALTRLGAPAVRNQLKIVVGDRTGPSGDQQRIEAVAQQVAGVLAERGQPVTRVDVPPPLRHPHQGQMTMVGFSLLAFGLTALLLSAILVATMLGGMLAGQIRQIGAMKAVGARTGQVLGMYLVQVTAIALLATALAVAPGVALGRFLAERGARLLNLDLTSEVIPGWVYAVTLLAGVGVPLLVALAPLIRGSRVSVRQAIDDHGTASVRATGAGPLSRLPGVSSGQRLALRNLFRRRGRLALTAGLLAVAGTMFLTGLNTAGGWAALVDQGIAQRHYDLEVRLHQPYSAGRLTALATGVPGVTGAEAWGRTPTTMHEAGRVDVAHVYPDDAHDSFTVLAPPADTALLRLPLLAGRWLRAGDTDAVVINHLVPAQQAPGIRVGDPITLSVAGRTVTRTVVGIVSDFGTQGTAYLTSQEYAAVTGTTGQAQLLRVVTGRHDAASREAALDALERALGAAGIAIEQDLTVDTLQAALDGHVLVLADALIAIAVLTAVVGLLGLASAMSTSITERTREFGVLHAIGATATAVRGIVVTEGVLTGVLSLAVALAAAPGLTLAFGRFIGTQAFRQPLPYEFSAAALALWTLLALGGAALVSAAAARRASRLTVREALATV